MRKPILNHTKRGELVYEPFLGSGTTLAAAELTERVCYGLELDPKYVDVVVERWQALTRQESHARRRRAHLRRDCRRTFERRFAGGGVRARTGRQGQDACVQLSLPSIRTAQDVEKAADKVMQAIGRGKITPLEAGKLMSILESRSRILENVQFESRLEKLEENLAAREKLPRAA